MDLQALNELSYKINGAVFEVQKVIGGGFLEKVYENALLVELRNSRIICPGPSPIESLV